MSESNPFATRYTRPGAVEYQFAEGESLGVLIERLREEGWWGEIIGPHGSGKSTLLATLVPALVSGGRNVVWRQVRRDNEPAGEKQVVATFAAAIDGCEAWDCNTLLVLDGYEQFSWWTRHRVQRICRKRGAGLLVTAHRSVGLPPLVHMAPSLRVAQQVALGLLPAGDQTVTAADVAQAYQARQGNIRETLFALFDVYRSRQQPGQEKSRPPSEV